MKYIRLGEVISNAKCARCGENDFPILSITKSDGIVLQSEKFKKRIASNDTAIYKVVKRGQLVQGIHIDEANFGVQNIVNEGIVSPAYKIWDIDEELICPQYLEIILRSPRSTAYYASKFNGSIKRRERLSDADFLSMEIPFPEYSGQEYAVQLLEKVSQLIEHRKEQLSELDTFIKARFVEMFGDPIQNTKGWKTEKLSMICSAIYGGGTPSKSHPEYFEGDIPWVSPKDMKSMVITDSIDHITAEAVDNSSTKMVPAGAVLIVIRSGILKHSLPVALAAVDLTVNQDMKAFITGDKLSSEFLVFYFKAIESDILSGVRGVTADNIDFKEFQNRMVIVPPMQLQNQFADFVAQVDKSKLSVQKSLDQLETLKKALMQQYFE